MGLLDYIERLQKEPKGKRERIAVVTAGSVTAVIALVWLSSLTGGFGLADREIIADRPSRVQQAASALSTFEADISSSLEELSQQWENITGSFTSSTTTDAASVAPPIDRNGVRLQATSSAAATTTTNSRQPSNTTPSDTDSFAWPR